MSEHLEQKVSKHQLKNHLTKALCIAMVAALALVTTACTAPAPAASGSGSGSATTQASYPLGKTQIQALGGGVCGAPTYIAVEKGFFAEQGIDVELVSGTFAQQQSGLQSGQFLVANGDFQFFPAVNEGLDLNIIGGLHEGCIKLLVPKDSPIQTVADLKGKKIGVDEIGGTPWAITSVALAQAGIDPGVEAGQVTWAPYDLSVLSNVASAGEIDAFAAWDPFGTLAEKDDGARVLVDIGEDSVFAGKYCCFLYASADAVNNQPDQVKALLNGWYKAVEWISANPEEAAKIITDGSQHEAYVASDDTALIAELLSSYHYQNHHDSTNQGQAKTDALYFADELKKTGYLPADLNSQDFINKLWVDILGK
ncbi:ABC transporter substrate-binding protein [Actinomycetota bacterium]|nr:ABC transporter substrate-binding protein [Actinomycetota bacterium]